MIVWFTGLLVQTKLYYILYIRILKIKYWNIVGNLTDGMDEDIKKKKNRNSLVFQIFINDP